MANSQGFTLPFTGRLGKLTTGYRAGRYITRVIPDVKPTGVPTDEQVMQRDLFGKVTAFYSNLKSVVDLGFASKRGDAMNYAIKKNWFQFYLGADFELGYNFTELSFSEGKLAPVSITSLTISRFGNARYIRVNFVNDYSGMADENDDVVVVYYLQQARQVLTLSRRKRREGYCYSADINGYKGDTAEVSIFLSNGKESSNTIFCGTLQLDW